VPYCPHCNRATFETEEVDIGGAKYKCVQCSGCKAPLGFLPGESVGPATDEFETRVTEVLRVIVSTLQAMSGRLARIDQFIQTKR
jgi:hypothetical protein